MRRANSRRTSPKKKPNCLSWEKTSQFKTEETITIPTWTIYVDAGNESIEVIAFCILASRSSPSLRQRL